MLAKNAGGVSGVWDIIAFKSRRPDSTVNSIPPGMYFLFRDDHELEMPDTRMGV